MIYGKNKKMIRILVSAKEDDSVDGSFSLRIGSMLFFCLFLDFEYFLSGREYKGANAVQKEERK